MIITIIFCLLMALSITWIILDRRYEWESELGAWTTTSLIGLLLIINTFFILTASASTRSDIAEFEAAKFTIQQQRANGITEYERATLTKEIVDRNQWLARNQFWANNPWQNWYYDKAILDVKPIE